MSHSYINRNHIRTGTIECRRAKPLIGARFEMPSDFVCANCKRGKPTNAHVCRSPKCACACNQRRIP